MHITKGVLPGTLLLWIFTISVSVSAVPVESRKKYNRLDAALFSIGAILPLNGAETFEQAMDRERAVQDGLARAGDNVATAKSSTINNHPPAESDTNNNNPTIAKSNTDANPPPVHFLSAEDKVEADEKDAIAKAIEKKNWLDRVPLKIRNRLSLFLSKEFGVDTTVAFERGSLWEGDTGKAFRVFCRVPVPNDQKNHWRTKKNERLYPKKDEEGGQGGGGGSGKQGEGGPEDYEWLKRPKWFYDWLYDWVEYEIPADVENHLPTLEDPPRVGNKTDKIMQKAEEFFDRKKQSGRKKKSGRKAQPKSEKVGEAIVPKPLLDEGDGTSSHRQQFDHTQKVDWPVKTEDGGDENRKPSIGHSKGDDQGSKGDSMLSKKQKSRSKQTLSDESKPQVDSHRLEGTNIPKPSSAYASKDKGDGTRSSDRRQSDRTQRVDWPVKAEDGDDKKLSMDRSKGDGMLSEKEGVDDILKTSLDPGNSKGDGTLSKQRTSREFEQTSTRPQPQIDSLRLERTDVPKPSSYVPKYEGGASSDYRRSRHTQKVHWSKNTEDGDVDILDSSKGKSVEKDWKSR
ncbi:hypothetical protein F5880DRAFT_262180, partial [Lentinula raphanica]